MKINAYAKINLTLDVVCRREDGYHELSSVMQTIALHDILSVDMTESGNGRNLIDVAASVTNLPCNEKNLCFRACESFFSAFGIQGKKVIIYIEKHIPVAAGLGGGSSDCAATLIALDRLFGTNAGKKLDKIAAGLGADVPFFLHGGCLLAEGIGEKLTPVSLKKKFFVLLAKPGKTLSAAEIYKEYDNTANSSPDLLAKPSTKDFLLHADSEKCPDFISNMLAIPAEKKCPESAELRKFLTENGADAACVSGSGPTVFGIFTDRQKAEQAEKLLKEKYPSYFRVLTGTV